MELSLPRDNKNTVIDNKIILITGGTGLIGKRLVALLLESRSKVRLLSRKPERIQPATNQSVFNWNGLEIPKEALQGSDVVVHLAGQPVLRMIPGSRHRARIHQSRIESTRLLVNQIGSLERGQRPKVLICASATGYYESKSETCLDESAEPGKGYLASVCQDWEQEAQKVEQFDVRRVSVRIGVVLASQGGAFPLIKLPFRLGLGGPIGHGHQWFPWIHLEDICNLLIASIDNELYKGPINGVAPNPIRNIDFTRQLARVLRRPAFIRVPSLLVRLLLGPLATELLGSRRVIPNRALSIGFTYHYTDIKAAFDDLTRP